MNNYTILENLFKDEYKIQIQIQILGQSDLWGLGPS